MMRALHTRIVGNYNAFLRIGGSMEQEIILIVIQSKQIGYSLPNNADEDGDPGAPKFFPDDGDDDGANANSLLIF